MGILELEQEILALDLENQVYLANSLFKHIEDSANEDYESQWLELARNRLDEIENGKIKLIDGIEVMNLIRENY